MSLTPEQREQLDAIVYGEWDSLHQLSDSLAPVVQEMLAEAWQEGWHQFQSQVSYLEDDPGDPDEMNPYRSKVG